MAQINPASMQAVFYPERVAVIGITDSPERVGYNILRSILYGGFAGKVYPVHPRHEQVLGCKVYKSLDDLPEPVDMAVICLNQYATVEAVENCGRAGVKGVVCGAGGYRETGRREKSSKGNWLPRRKIRIADYRP